jgi:hypothetical protein
MSVQNAQPDLSGKPLVQASDMTTDPTAKLSNLSYAVDEAPGKCVAPRKGLSGSRIVITMALVLFVLTSGTPSFAQTAQPAQELAFRKGWQWPASSDGITYIPVCWENGYGYASEKDWVKDAIGGTWEAIGNLNFHGWGQCNNASQGIRIVVEDIRSHSLVGHGMDGERNGMSLNFTFNNFSKEACQSNKEYCIKSIAVHEFGHALGFIHEQDRPDSICYEGRSLDDDAGELTPYDEDSVMNYCNRKWNNNGNLSSYDISGVRKIYGSKTTASRGHLTVTDELADDQTWEKVTMSLRGEDEKGGAVQIFNLNSSNPKVTKGWNFFGTGTYYYEVETLTTLRDGRSIRGYAQGSWKLTNGEKWELALYANGWNTAGYLNLELKGNRKSK